MAPTQVVWIGLGNMGRGMAKNIVEKGNLDQPLILFNRTAKRAEDLQATLPEGKSVVGSSLEDCAAKGDIIFTCLGEDPAVKDTYTTMLKADAKGKLFVECSTVHPETTEMLAKAVHAQGGAFVACPVFGAPAMADAGKLICVLAGEQAAIDRVRPFCKGVMGRAEIDLVDKPCGQATLLKVIGNTFVLSMVETIAEGHTVAEKCGLEDDKLFELIDSLFGGPYGPYSKRMTSGEYYKREEPYFGVDLARKDARHAMDLAKSAGTRLQLVEVADQHLAEVQKRAGSKGDIAGIYGAVRAEAGLSFEK